MSKASSNKGFSLPEVLVALAVFGTMAAALTSVLRLNVNWNRLVKEMTAATSLAQDTIEGFRASATQPVGTNVTDTPTVDGLSYTRKWTATTPSGLPPGVSQVTVQVTWSEPESQSVTLTSYVTY